MRRIFEYEPGDPLPEIRGAVATIGVFDGVHLGHRAILDRTISWARMENLPSALITFSVHPDLVVRGRAPALLLSLDHRLREIERAGIDHAIILHFDARLREMSAEEFVATILVRSLSIRGLVLGHDTAVGRDRRGDSKLLSRVGAEHGFQVQVVGEIAVDGQVVSSTRIREALQAGDLEEASRMLGRPPSVFGRVVAGERRGRTLGFPTANLDTQSECLPALGVYAVIAAVEGAIFEGICNIGRRPTFHQGADVSTEVHLLDFYGDLYAKVIEVVFLARLRGEKAFPDKDSLVKQIHEDRAAALEIFRRYHGAGRKPRG